MLAHASPDVVARRAAKSGSSARGPSNLGSLVVGQADIEGETAASYITNNIRGLETDVENGFVYSSQVSKYEEKKAAAVAAGLRWGKTQHSVFMENLPEPTAEEQEVPCLQLLQEFRTTGEILAAALGISLPQLMAGPAAASARTLRPVRDWIAHVGGPLRTALALKAGLPASFDSSPLMQPVHLSSPAAAKRAGSYWEQDTGRMSTTRRLTRVASAAPGALLATPHTVTRSPSFFGQESGVGAGTRGLTAAFASLGASAVGSKPAGQAASPGGGVRQRAGGVGGERVARASSFVATPSPTSASRVLVWALVPALYLLALLASKYWGWSW